MKLYKYVGPNDLLHLVKTVSKGKTIVSPKDVLNWVQETKQSLDQENCVIATYIVNSKGDMLIADRHSEHVVCAGGENVLSAGEITFRITDHNAAVSELTNQSTGYCPEPESWAFVKESLEKAGIVSPEGFSTEFIFGKCVKCGAINIVKDNWYVCMECDGDLPNNGK